MPKRYYADDLVVARLKLNFQGSNQETRKYIFVNKYSRILDIPWYKSILTKKKYFNSLYSHYAGDFYLINIESYTNYFPEYCGKKVDEETLMLQLATIRNKDLNKEPVKENRTNSTIDQKKNNENKKNINRIIKKSEKVMPILYDDKKITANMEVIGTLPKETKEPVKFYVTREELTSLLEGKSILVRDINTPLEISMKEDVYSSLEKNKDSLKENSRANKRKIKKREKI